MTLEGGGTNATVTIFNCAALIAVSFHLISAIMVLVGVHPKKDFTHKKVAVTAACGVTAFILLLLTK